MQPERKSQTDQQTENPIYKMTRDEELAGAAFFDVFKKDRDISEIQEELFNDVLNFLLTDKKLTGRGGPLHAGTFGKDRKKRCAAACMIALNVAAQASNIAGGISTYNLDALTNQLRTELLSRFKNRTALVDRLGINESGREIESIIPRNNQGIIYNPVLNAIAYNAIDATGLTHNVSSRRPLDEPMEKKLYDFIMDHKDKILYDKQGKLMQVLLVPKNDIDFRYIPQTPEAYAWRAAQIITISQLHGQKISEYQFDAIKSILSDQSLIGIPNITVPELNDRAASVVQAELSDFLKTDSALTGRNGPLHGGILGRHNSNRDNLANGIADHITRMLPIDTISHKQVSKLKEVLRSELLAKFTDGRNDFDTRYYRYEIQEWLIYNVITKAGIDYEPQIPVAANMMSAKQVSKMQKKLGDKLYQIALTDKSYEKRSDKAKSGSDSVLESIQQYCDDKQYSDFMQQSFYKFLESNVDQDKRNGLNLLEAEKKDSEEDFFGRKIVNTGIKPCVKSRNELFQRFSPTSIIATNITEFLCQDAGLTGRNGALHGGIFGRHNDTRNQIVKLISDELSQRFPNDGPSCDQMDNLKHALHQKIASYKSGRTDFASSIGITIPVDNPGDIAYNPRGQVNMDGEKFQNFINTVLIDAHIIKAQPLYERREELPFN